MTTRWPSWTRASPPSPPAASPSWSGCIEHPPLYTAGTSANVRDVLDARFPVFEAGRGGQLTYHGPGQRVAYVMLDLKRRGPDVRRFVATLEEWIIRTLAAFNVRGERREDRIGVWVRRPDKGEGFEDKIAAIGIRVKQWVTLHGMALNVDPDLTHFAGIVPCGVSEQRYGVTSLVDLGLAGIDAGGRQGAAAGVRGAVRRHRGSGRRQFRKRSARQAQLEFVRGAFALIERIDARRERAAPAGLDHLGDDGRRTGEQRLDRTVAAIAHPAFEPALERLALDKGAEADALHAAAQHDVADDLRVHASSPGSPPARRQRPDGTPSSV